MLTRLGQRCSVNEEDIFNLENTSTASASQHRKYFGTDGIRGHVGSDPLVPDFITRLGYAAGTVITHQAEHPTFVIGRDTRQSGEMLQNALTEGLLASGANVIDLGVIPTPGVAFMVNEMHAEDRKSVV